MGDKAAKTLRSVAKVLAVGGVAAVGLAVVVFVFALVAHGFDGMTGLDWVRKLLLLVGRSCSAREAAACSSRDATARAAP